MRLVAVVVFLLAFPTANFVCTRIISTGSSLVLYVDYVTERKSYAG